MARRTVRSGLDPTEERLVKDIREFIPMFGRKPTPEEVVDWARDEYHYHIANNHTTRWATKLIRLATREVRGEKTRV